MAVVGAEVVAEAPAPSKGVLDSAVVPVPEPNLIPMPAPSDAVLACIAEVPELKFVLNPNPVLEEVEVMLDETPPRENAGF